MAVLKLNVYDSLEWAVDMVVFQEQPSRSGVQKRIDASFSHLFISTEILVHFCLVVCLILRRWPVLNYRMVSDVARTSAPLHRHIGVGTSEQKEPGAIY